MIIREIIRIAIDHSKGTYRIDYIVNPNRLIVINMQNQQACSIKRVIPSYWLSVLQQIILVFAVIIIYNVCIAMVAQCFHLRNRGV